MNCPICGSQNFVVNEQLGKSFCFDCLYSENDLEIQEKNLQDCINLCGGIDNYNRAVRLLFQNLENARLGIGIYSPFNSLN